MKYDKIKWVIPILSLIVFVLWLKVIEVVSFSDKYDMKGLHYGIIMFSLVGAVFMLLGYILIPVTHFFLKKGILWVCVYIIMVCILPSLFATFLLSGNDMFIFFFVCLKLFMGFNLPYFLLLIFVLKKSS
ncbi:MAG TPA: hypothetical protein PK252_08665 [Bacteroidales bacterium]|nr:hypothetical protein [Bacteroidales bacterium]